jgi:hypothetical protein
MKRSTYALLLATVTAAAALGLVAQAQSADPGADVTPPAGSVSLPAVVTTTAIGVQLSVSDPESGVVAVRASNDGVTFGEWTAPPSPAPGSSVSVLSWVLADGDGTKTVTIEARNGGGTVSSFTATTTLDTAPPMVTGSDPANGAALSAAPTLIVVHYSEPLASSSLPTATMPGGPVFTVTVSGSDVRLKPRKAITPGATYQLRVDGVRDLAGNVAEPAVIGFSVEKGAPAIAATATPKAVVYGSRTLIRGKVSRPGVLVVLYRRTVGETVFRRIASFTASATGVFTFKPAPVVATTYRLHYAGDEHWLSATTELTVKVKPRIVLGASPQEFFLGGRTVLTGVVKPAHPGATVVLQRLLNGAWTDWRTLTLDASSRFSSRVKPTSWGLRYFRVRMDADAEHATGLSPRLRVVVDNPNPHHISILFRKFIVIDISECHLYYYETGRVMRRIDVVLGKPSTPTPRGQWAVYTKSINPGGPFGVYAMFYYRGYGIHGTNEPWLLSLWPRYFSHGCCRMSNANITWLWPRCPIGTPVRNVY